MNTKVKLSGFHKLFNATDFPAISSLKDESYNKKIIFITCDSEDASIFGSKYREGNTYTWGRGVLCEGHVFADSIGFDDSSISITANNVQAAIEQLSAHTIKTVNNQAPDASGNVNVESGSLHILHLEEITEIAMTMIPQTYDKYGCRTITFKTEDTEWTEDEINAYIRTILSVDTLPNFTDLANFIVNNNYRAFISDTPHTVVANITPSIVESDYIQLYITANGFEGDTNEFILEIGYDTPNYIHYTVIQHNKTEREKINELIDDSDSDYIKYYDTSTAYEADTTRKTPSVSYIEETDELKYDNGTTQITQ